MSDRNLLEETLHDLKIYDHKTEDVLWVGTADGTKSISWKGFAALAKNTNYNAGFGGPEIRMSLVVVGENWWLERHEYDGSEWWEYKRLPELVINPGRLYAVLDDGFEEAHEISNPVRDQFEEWKEDASEEELKGLTDGRASKKV
jgi:hypothetical protein